MRQSGRRAARNLKQKEAYKNALKQVRKLVAAKKISEAEKIIPAAYKALDKAAKTGVIKPNTAARRKSRLMAWIKKQKTSA